MGFGIVECSTNAFALYRYLANALELIGSLDAKYIEDGRSNVDDVNELLSYPVLTNLSGPRQYEGRLYSAAVRPKLVEPEWRV